MQSARPGYPKRRTDLAHGTRWAGLILLVFGALAAESNNSPDAAALLAQADRTVTDQAPVVPLDTPSNIDFVSARVGNYQYSFQQAMLWDQFWVR